jgi:hypothetical protein
MLQYIQYERISQKLIRQSKENSTDNSNEKNYIHDKDNYLINSQQLEKENFEKNLKQKELKTKHHKLNENENDFNLNSNINIHININNTLSQNILNDEVIEEMNKEIETTNEKIKKCLNNFQTVNSNLNIIKKYIAEINDFSIIW